MLFFKKLGGAASWQAAFNSPSGEPGAFIADYAGVEGGQFFANGDNTKTFSGIHTFTRGSTALNRNSSGIYETLANDAHRLDHAVNGDRLGLLIEEARTNLCLWSDDWTNAAYDTVTNITAAKDQTGADGVSNSASSLLATAANAIITQSITSASATRVYSVLIKRLVGTGNIEITQNGGASWLDVNSLINSSTYTQVVRAAALITDPVVGVRIVTDGDKIAVQYGASQIASYATSPIPTTTVAVTRAAEVCSVATADFDWGGNIGGLSVKAGGDMPVGILGTPFMVGTEDPGPTGLSALSGLVTVFLDMGSGAETSKAALVGSFVDTQQKTMGSWNATNVKLAHAGSTLETRTHTPSMDTVTTLYIGTKEGSSGWWNSHFQYVATYAPAGIMSDADVNEMATP